jgi:very-short-patch-repair endonuclease
MCRVKAQRDFARTLRNEPTPAEKRLWHFLRVQKLRGYKFRHQAAIGNYIVDFVCFATKLIVELDGPQHFEPEAAEYDKRRTEWLSNRGFHVLRFRNQELDVDTHAVVAAIECALAELSTSAECPLPNPPRRGEGVEPR